MGQVCFAPSTPESKQNKKIDQDLKVAQKEDERKIKLLLLGAGESGKSTLFKQMRLLYSEKKDFTSGEREEFKKNVFKNIVSDMKLLISSTETHTNIKSDEALTCADFIMKQESRKGISNELAEKLLTVWTDEGTQLTWENRGDIQVQDSLEYFLMKQNLNRIKSDTYIPTNMDILRCRIRTSGIVEEVFTVDNANLEMYDVGGQRNERRKWIEAFDGVTGVIFVAAISEYNQYLFEDNAVSRQQEALSLFKEQLNLEVWKNTPFILFLNKIDLFREKLHKIPFKVERGPERRNVSFSGPHCDMSTEYAIDGSDPRFEACYDASCNYLQALYENQSPDDREALIYAKFTNSTDTENIQHIMTSCKDIILRGNLARAGWLPPPGMNY